MDPLDRGPLERDLRDLLTDDRLALPTHWVGIDAIRAGATRRRRRRAAVTAVAGAVVVAAVAGSALLAYPDRGGRQPAGTATSSGQQTERPTSSASGSTATTPLPEVVGPSWDDAHVMSMTATSTRTIVVLGATTDATPACPPSDCARLAESHDGGRTFTSLPVPAATGEEPRASRTATDVRFGSALDGWLFGGGLWSSHDGGESWTKIALGGQVRRLEAAAGHAWALVGAHDREQLWTTSVGTDDWHQVDRVTITGPGDLAVQGTRVIVLGTYDEAWTNDSGAFRQTTNPCASSLQVRLSGSGSLWATCVTGTAAHLATSTDDGQTWSTVNVDTGQGALPNSVTVGARSTGEAVVAIPQQPLSRLSTAGTLTAVSDPPTGGDVDYLGFTSRDVGYAIVGGTTLWRTDDGAETWRPLDITTP
jgi:photosystem II stability/assembly factor-like uncharacterized protein